MTRRTDASCLGMAVKGYLLLNLWVIVGLAVFVAIEKLSPFGQATRWLGAAALIALGAYLLIWPR